MSEAATKSALTSLARAREAKARGDVALELETLLDAWSARPAPELAALVASASERVAALHPPIRAKTANAALVAWVELARRGEAVHVGVLLEGLEHAWGDFRSVVLVPRLEELKKCPPDPRIATALHARLRSVERANAGRAANKVWGRLLTVLGQADDPRSIAELESFLSWLEEAPARATLSGSLLASRGQALLERFRERHPLGPPSLAPDELAAVRAVAEQAPGVAPAPRPAPTKERASEQELLAAIYAAPDDDGPRQVYADWLVERGDPRGELINLQMQLAREPSAKLERRASTLVKKLRRALLGPLAGAVSMKDAVFERGFLVSGTVRVKSLALTSTELSLPEWGTVRRIEFQGPTLVTPAMGALEHVDKLLGPALNKLCAAGHARLRTIGADVGDAKIEGGLLTSPALRSLAKTEKLPRLSRLGLLHPCHNWRSSDDGTVGPSHFGWLWDSPVGRRLERLELCADFDSGVLTEWSAWLAGAPPRLRELALGAERWGLLGPRPDQIIFRRDEDGSFSHVVLGPLTPYPSRSYQERALDSLPEGAVSRLTLLPATAEFPTYARERDRLRARAEARFGTLRHVEWG